MIPVKVLKHDSCEGSHSDVKEVSSKTLSIVDDGKVSVNKCSDVYGVFCLLLLFFCLFVDFFLGGVVGGCWQTEWFVDWLVSLHIIFFSLALLVVEGSTSFLPQQKWVAILSAEHPTMAFHASITNPFGKGALINLLRQFKNVSVHDGQHDLYICNGPVLCNNTLSHMCQWWKEECSNCGFMKMERMHWLLFFF